LAGDRAIVEPTRSTSISIKDTVLKRAIKEASMRNKEKAYDCMGHKEKAYDCMGHKEKAYDCMRHKERARASVYIEKESE
jgi:hypothetical protein